MPPYRAHKISHQKTTGEKNKQQNKQKEKKTFSSAKFQRQNTIRRNLNYTSLFCRYYKAGGT